MKHASRLVSVLACGALAFACVPEPCSAQSSPRVSAGQTSSPTPGLFATTDSPSTLTINTIRYHDHGTYTRIVLVMTGTATIAETKGQHTTTIALANSSLSDRAQQQSTQKDFPHAVTISPQTAHTITITLNMDALRTYTLLTLDQPHRVVVDLFYPPPRSATPLRIVIDPGHGGKDPGTTGHNGTQEKTIVLRVAKTLRDLIKTHLRADVLLTRDKDVFLNLDQRVHVAETHKADLFISIHANSHPQRSIHGVEIYYVGEASDPRSLAVAARENGILLNEDDPLTFILADKGNDQKIEKSLNFAWTIRETLIPALQKTYAVKDHGVKSAPFHVLHKASMPGILAEIGFLSNPAEEQRLRNTAFQKELAEGIYHSIRQCTQSLEAPCIIPATASQNGP